jgi:DNA-binding NtrC family response regulator
MLTVVHPPELTPASFALHPGLTFGRSPEPDLACIPHATVSRRHASVQAAMGGVLCLADLGSRNGTKLDGARSALPMPLLPQVIVRLGDVHAVVHARSERSFGEDPVLPGTSVELTRIREQLERIAPDSAPILITGETGTGKERLAREVHARSGRSGAYVALNAAQLSPELIESQLFGHERGAFTGAATAKQGLFAAAHGGTLFLDEIGELPLDLQPKLLRVLEDGEVRRLGSVSTERFDTRIVAATNRDLPSMVEQGAFRRDLYARVSFYELRLPPLSQRRQDIFPWVSLLATSWARERGVSAQLTFLPDAVERILLHSWPDNLRGLDRMVHRLCSLGEVRAIGPRALIEQMPELATVATDAARATQQSSLPPAGSSPDAEAVQLPASPRPSRDELMAVYEASGCSVRATAKHFGRDRRQIYRWLESFGIPRDPQQD